jgi:hypothetical protein
MISLKYTNFFNIFDVAFNEMQGQIMFLLCSELCKLRRFSQRQILYERQGQ